MEKQGTNKLNIKAAYNHGDNCDLPFTIEFTEWDPEDVEEMSYEVAYMESYMQATALVQTLMDLLPAGTFMNFVNILQEQLAERVKKFTSGQ